MTARQGLNISVPQLRKLADDLEKEHNEMCEEFGLEKHNDKLKYLIPIVNKTPECSDTWEIEDIMTKTEHTIPYSRKLKNLGKYKDITEE